VKFRLLARALVLYGVALALRLRNLKAVLADGKVLFGLGDPYYHLRRVLLTLEHFPRVPSFDSYTNFPEGARIIWPPGFDLLVAAVSWIAGLGHPSRHRVEATAALLIPFLGAVTAVVVLLLAEEILGRGRWEAFAAGLLFAFLPAQQTVSLVGRLDHHVVEMTAFGFAVLFFLRAIRDDPGSRYSFWGGLALAAGTYCWSGSILYGGFLVAFAILELILERAAGRRPDAGTGRSATRVLFWGGLLLVPLVLVTPGEGRTSLTYLFLSWYQPVLLGVGAFLVASLSGALFAPADRRGRIRALRGFFLSAILAAGGLFLLAQGSGGIRFLARRDPIINLLAESRPAWGLSPGLLVEHFSYLVYLVPLAGLALIRAAARARFTDVRLNALLALFLFTAALGVTQARFLNYFAVPFCIATMWGFRALVNAARKRATSRPLRWSATAACAVVLAVPLWPTLRASFRSLPGDAAPGFADLYSSLEWIRDRTPTTSHFADPVRAPEYGILADPSFGHWITTIAERPNFSNPFSLALWHERPILESARFFLSEEEGPLVADLSRRRLRYVLLYGVEEALPGYARLAGRSVEDYLQPDPSTGGSVPAPRFFRTFGVRLALADGSAYQAAGEEIPALSHFRLVHESKATRPPAVPGLPDGFLVSRVKVFERVEGARVEGTADPGSEVLLQIPVVTDAGRRFEYRASVHPGDDGAFAVVVPYPTGTSGEVSAQPARITTSRCSLEVTIPEGEVLGGGTRTVRCR